MQTKTLGRKINTSLSTGHLKTYGAISDAETKALLKQGHHVERRSDEDEQMVPKRFNQTVKTTVYIPEEKIVKVPVVRKEKEKIVEKHTVKATRLVPVTKYKEVQEIGLHDRKPVAGEKARSGDLKMQVIKTSETAGRTRKVPYTDFVEEEYEITVDVPREVVKTRTGYRMDKQLSSQRVEVEEDCVYEMRPVLIRKGEARAKPVRDKERHGKAVHGDPVWDGGLHDGWRPELGNISNAGSRPGSAYSRASRPGTAMSRPDTGMPFEFTQSRPGTGMRSAPNLHSY